MAELNRSQGEIYIRGGGRIDLGAAGRFCCASLKHGPAAALHLLVSVGQRGETVAHFLLCCGPGAQAYVGGHFLARSAPGGLGVVEVRTVLGSITELPAFHGHGLPLYPNIRPTMMTTY